MTNMVMANKIMRKDPLQIALRYLKFRPRSVFEALRLTKDYIQAIMKV